MGFVLFILVTVTLFVRPAEVVPELLGLPIYECLILTCLAASLQPVLEQLTTASLASRPITVCVVGLLFAVVLSHLSHGFIWGARMSGFLFLKIVIYYLLFVGLVDTPVRLRQFLFWIVGLTAVLAVIALAHYHEVVYIPAIGPLETWDVEDEGEANLVIRLRGTGIFNDPNDLSLMLLVSMAACAYWLSDRRSGLLRLAWLAPLGLFGYALALTHSRGGFLALVAGSLVLLRARFGLRKALLLSALALPALFVVFAGRMTDISTTGNTGQARIQLWSEAIALFREAPLFGIGHGEFVEEVGHAAHNSYLHCYAELGFFGGTLFLGAFCFALWTVYRVGSARFVILDPDLRRMQPYMLAVVAAYATGMLTLSRAFIVPTYMVLGLVTAYLRVAAVYPALALPRFDWHVVRRLSMASVGFVAASYVFVRVFVRWG